MTFAESGNDDYRWVRRILGYAVAGGTAYIRMKDNVHWLSDTVAGAALGVATARFVLNREDGGPSGAAWPSRRRRAGGWSRTICHCGRPRHTPHRAAGHPDMPPELERAILARLSRPAAESQDDATFPCLAAVRSGAAVRVFSEPESPTSWDTARRARRAARMGEEIPGWGSARQYSRVHAAIDRSPAPRRIRYDKDNAEWILAKFKEWGFDARIETSMCSSPPEVRVLEMLKPASFTPHFGAGSSAGSDQRSSRRTAADL